MTSTELDALVARLKDRTLNAATVWDREGYREALAAIITLRKSEDELRKKVEIAAIIFEEYGRLHRKKGTRDGDLKAVRNEQYAAEMRQALSNTEGGEGCVRGEAKAAIA